MNEDAVKGCIYGVACGDYLGSPVEFKHADEIAHIFSSKSVRPLPKDDPQNEREIVGYYTDDTSQTLCLLESLIEKQGFDATHQLSLYKKWLFDGYMTPYGDKSFGCGQHTLKVLLDDKDTYQQRELYSDERGAGNGALMRCSPIALLYGDTQKIKEYSIASTLITHNNKEAAWSCVILNTLINYSLLNYEKDSFLERVIEEYDDLPDSLHPLLNCDYSTKSRHDFETSGYTLNTLEIALYAFFSTNTFEEAISEAIFIGGDTDTQAAVAGSLAGTHYGYNNIPKDWVEHIIGKEKIDLLVEKTLAAGKLER